jgi:hypothetical protein
MLLKSSGGSYRPRSYGRPHDFRYEREQQVKPPKEVETHYAREERIPGVPPNPYRPETALGETGRAHEIERGYLASERQERTENATKEYEVESNFLGTETELDSRMTELLSRMGQMELVPTVESAETTLRDPNDSEIDAALRAPELYEVYEYPAKDLKLLMTEIDAILVKPETKVDQQVESGENAERSL